MIFAGPSKENFGKKKMKVFKQAKKDCKSTFFHEDMTVHLLKQVLDDLNITYRSSE